MLAQSKPDFVPLAMTTSLAIQRFWFSSTTAISKQAGFAGPSSDAPSGEVCLAVARRSRAKADHSHLLQPAHDHTIPDRATNQTSNPDISPPYTRIDDLTLSSLRGRRMSAQSHRL